MSEHHGSRTAGTVIVESRSEVVELETRAAATRWRGGETASIHRLVIDHVDRTGTSAFRVTFRCTCGDYTAEETAATEADAVPLAANEARVHEATVTGAPTVDIRI